MLQNGFALNWQLGVPRTNIQIVSFLDVKLNLVDGSFKPYRKNEEVLPVYIHVDSNHPPNTKKDLPKMISKRVSDLSSSKEVFDSEKNVYDQALNNAGYKDKLQYFYFTLVSNFVVSNLGFITEVYYFSM